MTKIAIAGCAGRMGRMLVREAASTKGCELTAGSVKEGTAEAREDIGTIAGLQPVGILSTTDNAQLTENTDVVIDFTIPELTLELAHICAERRISLVTGTTGLNEAQQSEIISLAQKTIIVQAGNMSLGVNMLLELVEQTAARLDDRYDIEILEMHHRHKQDAPSGTALMLGSAAAKGRDISLHESADMAREGITGPRKQGNIGFSVLRGGDVVGEHTVIFAGEGERIEITHKASDRNIFARGAIQAALWAKDQPAGLYSMRDVLGLQ